MNKQHHQCGHNYDLIKIDEEMLGETPTLTIFQCPMCGENVHKIERQT